MASRRFKEEICEKVQAQTTIAISTSEECQRIIQQEEDLKLELQEDAVMSKKMRLEKQNSKKLKKVE